MYAPEQQYLRIEYRSAPSFLVAYSVSLARGGIFVETTRSLGIGAPVSLQLAVPGGGLAEVNGTFRYLRSVGDEAGPPGLGLELPGAGEVLADLVDRLALDYRGISILLLAGETMDRTSASRQIKSIFATADVVAASDARLAEAVLDDDIDIAIVDADYSLDASLETIQLAGELPVPVPTIGLTSDNTRNTGARARLLASGVFELANNPPAFAELQNVLVRALIRPRRVT